MKKPTEFTKLTILWQILTVLALWVLGSAVLGLVAGSPALTLVLGPVLAVATILVYRRVVAWSEGRTVDELGPPGIGRTTGAGVLGGMALFALAIGIIALLGGYQVDGLGSVSGLLWFTGSMALGAVREELMFRGVLFRHIERRFGTWIALVGTGALFGLMHLLNPDATLWGAIAIMIEAGGMLGAAWIATRRLWLPIGLHLGWNLAESGIFSTAVSGNGPSSGLLSSSVSGPTALTGGAFGPEASMVSVALCVAATIVLLVIAHRRGRIVPMRGAREASRAVALEAAAR
ncbi:CPBP family intramembrane glutamic endopeptidase [Brachybacterium sp. DNPG3]